MATMNGLSQLFPSLPLAPGGLFWVGLALVGAGLAGEVSRRWLRCPRIVGYAAAGLCAGMLGRGVVDETVRRRDSWLESVLVSLTPEQRDVLARAAVVMQEVAAQ